MNLSRNFTLSELIKSDTAIRKGINNNPNAEQIEKLKDANRDLGYKNGSYNDWDCDSLTYVCKWRDQRGPFATVDGNLFTRQAWSGEDLFGICILQMHS